MRTLHLLRLFLLLLVLCAFSYAEKAYAETANNQTKGVCDNCECADCDVNCVCTCAPCNCLCSTDSKAADANLTMELDTIVAFRNIQDMTLGEIVEILRANSSVEIETPKGKEDEKVSIDMVGVKFEDVLKELGLNYK